MPFIRALSGKLIKVPEGLSDEEALDLAKSKFPKEFADTRKAEEGFIPSVKSGAMGLASNVATAAAPLLGMSDDQTRRMMAKDQARQMETSSTPSWEDTKEAFAKHGVFGGEKDSERGGLGQLLRMWRGQLGESLPQMGATLAGARIGAGVGSMAGPVGTLAGGALGALGASIPGFIGSNVKRQADEQEQAGTKAPLDYRVATAAAVPQAGVDAASTLFVLGKLGMGKVLTKSLEDVAAKAGIKKAEEVLARTAQASLMRTAAGGAAKGVAVEMPTEIAQAVLERAQAGLDLFDEDARKEYEATAVGVAGPGAVFGVAGGFSGRSAARDKMQEIGDLRAQQTAAEAKKKADVEAAALAQVRQAKMAEAEGGFAPEGQGRLFGGDATPLPVAGNMQQLFKQMQEAEANGDTQTASQLRNDMQRLQSELNDPEALVQRRQQLQDARDGITEQIQAVAGKDPAAIKELRQKGAAITQELKRLDALLKQAPPSLSREQAEKKLKAMEKQLETAKRDGDEEVMDSLTDKIVALRPLTAQTGDLLAGVPELDMETASDRMVRSYEEGNPQAQVQQQPKPDNTFADDYMGQLDEAQQARVKQAREVAEAQRKQRQADAEQDVASGRAQRLVDDASIESILVAKGVPLRDTKVRRNYLQRMQNSIDNGVIDPQVSKLLGLPFKGEVFLNRAKQSRQVAAIIDARIKTLNDERSSYANKELVKDGNLTKDGKQLIGVEATLNELKRLQSVAQQNIARVEMTPAEAGLAGVAASQVNKLSDAQQEKKKEAALKRATDINKFTEQRKNQMFNWGNEIDSLRKGDNVGDVSRRAAELRAEQIALLAKMEAVKRVEQMGAQMPTAAQEQLEQDVQQWLGRITKNAKPGEPEGALQNELRDKIKVKQGSIERGMTITDTKEGELARLQQGVDRLIMRAVEQFKREKPKGRVGPFGLTQQSAEVLSKRYDAANADTLRRKEDFSEPDLNGRQKDMFAGSEAETYKKKRAGEKRTATVESKKQAQLEETKALMQKATAGKTAEKAERQRKLTRMKQVSDFWKKIDADKKEASTRVAKDRLKSLNTLKDKLETEIVAVKAEKETERLANIKLQGLASLGKLTNVKFSGDTQQHLKGLEAQLEAVKALIGKTEAEVAAVEKRAAEDAKIKAKKSVRFPAGQVAAPEDKATAPKEATPEEKADRDAMAAMRQRVETQEEFVAEAEAAIDFEIARIKKLLAEDFKDAIKGRWYARQDLELLSDMEFAAGLSEADTAKLKTEARGNIKFANAYRKVVSRESFKQKLLAENDTLQKAKKDLVPFTKLLRALRSAENTLAREQRVKQLRNRVLDSVDKVAAGMKRVDAAQDVEARRVKSILDDIAQGKIKGQRGLRAEQVATTLTPAQEKKIAAIEDKMDTLGEGVNDRRVRAELQEQIDKVRQGAYATIKRSFGETPVASDADIADLEAAQIKQSGTLKIEQRKEQPVGRTKPAKEIKRVGDRYLALRAAGKERQAQALREKHPDLFLGPLEGLVRNVENREGKRTPTPLRTGVKGYTPEFTTERDGVDTTGLGQQRRALDGDVDFRDATDTDTGVGTAEAQAIADRVKAALPSGVDFIYAPTLADAPAEFQAAVAASGRKAAKGAVMPDGRVIVVGEAHSSPKDVEETIAHELIGHYGADVILGPQGVEAMAADLTKKGLDHMAEVATGLGVFPDVASARLAMRDDAKSQGMTVLVREMIARAAEGRRVAPKFAEKVKTFIRDVISKVRGFFRNAGLSSLARADTKMIQKLLNDSQKMLASGRPGVYRTPDGEVVFRNGPTAPASAPPDIKKFVDKITGNDKKSVVDKVKANLWGIGGMTQFVDRFTPVKWAADLGIKLGKLTDLEALQNNYYLSSFGKRLNHVRDTIENGPRVLVEKTEDGETFRMIEGAKGEQPSLTKVFNALDKSGLSASENEAMFTVYMASQRIKNEGIGVDKLNFSEDITPEDFKKYEAYIKSLPQVEAAFNEARKIYNDFNRGLVQFAVDAGALSKEQFKLLTDKKDYIPFYRERNGNYELVLDDSSAPIIIGNLKDQPYMQELVGGNKRILPIFESALQNVNLLTDMALRNLATKDTAMLVSKLGMAETYSQDGVEKTIKGGMGGAGANVLRFKMNGDDVHIRVKTEGTAFEGIPAELLVKGMEGVKTTFPASLQLLGLPAKILRRFIVLSPLYPVRQVIRESLSTLGTSGANFVPIYDPLKNMASTLRGTNATAKLLQSQGFGGGQLLAGTSDTESMATLLRSVSSGKTTAGTLLAKLEAMSIQADVGLRVSAYDSFSKKQGLNSLRSWIATNEIIDFNRQGLEPSIYVANTLIPFFNTQIQGLSVLARAATGNMPLDEKLKIKEKFYKRGAMMAGLTMLYAAMMQDDEAYKNATPEVRMANWFVRVPGLDEPLKIPIPFEYGLIFKSTFEALYNVAFQNEEFKPIAKALRGQAMNAIPGMSGYMMPQAFKPVAEMVTGVDFFTGRDIESKSMAMLDRGERYSDNTTELAKFLGRETTASPVMVDHFIKSVGSQSLLALVSMTNSLFGQDNPPSASMKWSKAPLVGGIFQPTDAGAIINRVYEQMEEAVQAKNTYEKMLADGKEDQAERYLNTNIDRIMRADSAPSFRSDMKQLTEYERAVKADRDMTPREKRETLDAIRRQKIDTAKQYRDALREAA